MRRAERGIHTEQLEINLRNSSIELVRRIRAAQRGEEVDFDIIGQLVHDVKANPIFEVQYKDVNLESIKKLIHRPDLGLYEVFTLGQALFFKTPSQEIANPTPREAKFRTKLLTIGMTDVDTRFILQSVRWAIPNYLIAQWPYRYESHRDFIEYHLDFAIDSTLAPRA